jgi:hypothetical protein
MWMAEICHHNVEEIGDLRRRIITTDPPKGPFKKERK